MYIGVDLGSTNIKVAVYDHDFRLVDRQSSDVTYIRDNGFVEFDGEKYYRELLALIGGMLRKNGVTKVEQIAFTGQAESLVVLDSSGKPLMNAISWMDERSQAECRQLEAQFSPQTCREVTGQMAILPTWPATKILWLKHNRPEVYDRADCYMLLKDYIVYCLTGKKLADMSIATFSFYFDIYNKVYWQDMLDAIGISRSQLPELCEPCTVAGALLPQVAQLLGIGADTLINVGTLDHFAGMIGTGNTAPGGITLSTGTVMALATMSEGRVDKNSDMAMHYGFLPDTYVMLPVAESGGISLEWFHRTCMLGIDYDTMNSVLAEREPNELLFLPYLVGTNAPEFDSNASGAFWGLRQEHDAIDMAGAVMEGVSFVLRKNCDHIARKGVKLSSIIATGGGARSPVWCQLHADITGLTVFVPKEMEAACLGAAMVAAVSVGRFESFKQAAGACVEMLHTYTPRLTQWTERKYRRFSALYNAALALNEIE